MSLPSLQVVHSYRRRPVGSNAAPYGIQVPFDLTGGSGVVSGWLAESEELKVDGAPCVVTLVNATAPFSTISWAPAIEDLDTEGDLLLLFVATTAGGDEHKFGFFRAPIRRAGPPF